MEIFTETFSEFWKWNQLNGEIVNYTQTGDAKILIEGG
jgi:hypothetical protein